MSIENLTRKARITQCNDYGTVPALLKSYEDTTALRLERKPDCKQLSVITHPVLNNKVLILKRKPSVVMNVAMLSEEI